MKPVDFLTKYWYVFVLLVIFLFSYEIRAVNIVPDRLLSFDPIFQYRFTRYVVDWGHLPVWDELSYYVGRADTPNDSFLWYITAIFQLFLKSFGFSLLTTASYASAIYGAMIVIPAFLLGNKLSNKYGGLTSAVLMGTAPQILIRTFGSSYDTDQIVLFFILLTTYLGLRFLKNRNITNFSLALMGFTAFLLAWGMYAFPFFLLIGFVLVELFVTIIYAFVKKENKKDDFKFFKKIENPLKNIFALFCLFIFILLAGFILQKNALSSFIDITGFARSAEAWIVNISIAELQPFNIFNLEGWITAMGRFVTGNNIIDIPLFIIFMLSLIFGIIISFRRDLGNFSFILTLFLLGTYTTFRGVRFTEFSSAIFIVLISVGFGYLVEILSKKNQLLKAFSIGLIICIAFIAMNLGQQISTNLGPDINSNWDSAWEFLRTKTPELSLVGTWWDPGHMITGLAEKRVIADGAHCPNTCMYTINDRIVDLGLIMATTDENESLNLIRKYQGDSPKVYWIVSDDLIGKYQWLQYFGTGCDARTDSKCPLYMQLGEDSQSRLYDNNGNIALLTYPLGSQAKIMVYNSPSVPIPIYVQGINAALFDETIYYNGTQPVSVKFTQNETNALLTALKSLESQLNVRFTNQSIPMTVWIPNHFSYIVAIPPNLRDTVFTKMFMLEGQGLEHFKQVFRNDQVKIYEVV
jgi:asparagine N-glycosylation enzyme membrane subunit Stt3